MLSKTVFFDKSDPWSKDVFLNPFFVEQDVNLLLIEDNVNS